MTPSHTKTFGLVLAGGKSSRMKKDKTTLNFHGTTQTEYCVQLLQKLCSDVFISKRQDQNGVQFQSMPCIDDLPEFENSGPIGGILSAMKQHPGKACFAVAVDLPFITQETLHYIWEKRNPQKIATAFQSAHDQLPEPLCTIYEASAFNALLAFFKSGKTCPRKFLIQSDIECIRQKNAFWLDNVNDPEEYIKAQNKLKNHV